MDFINNNNNNNNIKMDYHQLTTHLHETFASHRTLSHSFRLHQLKQLLKLYEENQPLILKSLHLDMKKSELEGYLYEVDLMKNDVRNAIRNLKTWMGDGKVPRNILTPADRAFYVKQPLGVVLILAPWNYPWQLACVPLCGAIAAGNCVVIKPSEISTNSALMMAKLIPKYLDNDCYKVVLGGAKETQLLLDEKFDHIFYTGSMPVAKEIVTKANKTLTPCTLELGGKSPCYVDDTVNYKMTAARIMWGKCMNVGQTCVAPDYILCTREVQEKLIKEMHAVMDEWYGSNWKKARDLARIVNIHHFRRIRGLIEGAVKNGARLALGGDHDEQDLWIEPSVVVDCRESDLILKEEIFGPVLAILNVRSETEAVEFINSRSSPLCIYVFSRREKTLQRFQRETRSGTMAFNDTIIQFAIDELPFGGVGDSGHGSYHGKYTFDTFTHKKSIVARDFSYIGDKVGLFRYPPYTHTKINFLSFLLCHWKKFKFVYFDYMPEVLAFLAGVVLMGIYVRVFYGC